MKISYRDLSLIVILLGIAVFLVCYLAVYTPTTEENNALNGEINSLRPTLERLKDIEAKIPSYNQSMDESREMIAAVKAGFPTDVREEDYIMYAVALEEEIGIDTEGMSFTVPELVLAIEAITGPDGEVEFEATNTFKSTANINNFFNYDQMKDLVRYVYDDTKSVKTTLDTVSVNYNAETGELYGFIILGKYFMSAYSDPYIETYVPPMDVGVPNPFRVLESVEIDDGFGEGGEEE